MKMVSKLALAAVLSLGSVAAATAPAAAQKADKKGKDAAPQVQVSPEFRKAAIDAQAAIDAKNWAGADAPVAAVEAVAKTDDEKYYAARMRLTVELNKLQADQNRSFEFIIPPLDVLLQSTKTPQSDLKTYNYLRGWAAFNVKKHYEAIPYLLRAREGGSTEANLTLMLAQAYFEANKVPEGTAELNRAIDQAKASGGKPEESWFNFAIAKLYNSGDRAGTSVWLMRDVKEFPTVANWHRVIALYSASSDAAHVQFDRTQKIDLYRLMRVSGVLADTADYFDYARLAVDSGLPWEAVSVIDEGRKSGKVPAADAEFAKVYASAQTGVHSEGSLATLAAQSAKDANGKGLVATADAYLASGNYPRAIELYDAALAKGGIDAQTANLHRGVAMVLSGRKDDARTAFALVTTGPNGDIARFWSAWLDLPPLT